MTIEDEIWDEFNSFSSTDMRPRSFREINEALGFEYGEKIGVIARIDKPQFLWQSSVDIATDELIEKVLLGEKKWDQVIGDMPKRIMMEKDEAHFRRLNKMLLSIFQTTEDATQYLEIKKFPNGIECLRCGYGDVYVIENAERYKCKNCGYKFHAAVGTIFKNTNLDLLKWYSAMVIINSGFKVSVVKLSDILKVTYSTAWRTCDKIKKNITDPFLHEVNRGIFEYQPKRKQEKIKIFT